MENLENNRFHRRCQRDVGRLGKSSDVLENYILLRKNMENIWTTGIIVMTEKRDILGIDYRKLREVVKIENQIRVPSLIELATIKFCGWTMEIDRKDLHWMMVNRMPEQILKRLEEYRSWLDRMPVTTKVEMLWKFGYSLQWMVPSHEIEPREFYAIEKGWASGWNKKSKEKVSEIRKREFSHCIQGEQKKKQRQEDRSGDRISK
jgi:hypothetical protein